MSFVSSISRFARTTRRSSFYHELSRRCEDLKCSRALNLQSNFRWFWELPRLAIRYILWTSDTGASEDISNEGTTRKSAESRDREFEWNFQRCLESDWGYSSVDNNKPMFNKLIGLWMQSIRPLSSVIRSERCEIVQLIVTVVSIHGRSLFQLQPRMFAQRNAALGSGLQLAVV